MVGQVLGGRYQLLEQIGEGGMALVYKARDQMLNRFVAIKVLRAQFEQDKEFIRRFHREAQSAGSLSHPNIVSMYDVGQQGDIHYIVMEYVDGRNLNEWIREKAPLQVDEAVHIASQIGDALSHAHLNGIIHRDIKPHNIIIGRNGRIKVTDFGIARVAAGSADITQTGEVLGSVHYFSPEHAKGVTQDTKSDLYSLGIVLYQMLTNRLPFLGESPISVALKHLQEEVEEPRKVNPLIPQSVENIILRAMRKDPAERYQSAQDMLNDLETCLTPERLHEEKVTFAKKPSWDDDEQTKIMPAIRNHQSDASSSTDLYGQPRSFRLEEEEEESGFNHMIWVKPLIWLILSVGVIWLSWTGVKALVVNMSVPNVSVPDVVGKPLEEAVKMLEDAGLIVEEPQYEYDEEVKEGVVIRQNKTNMEVKEKSPIIITVSQGVEVFQMHDYTELTLDDALENLRKLGFDDDRITVTPEHSDDVKEGIVLSQNPLPNTDYRLKDVKIELVVSDGPNAVFMPNMIAQSLDMARSLALRNKLEVHDTHIRYEYSYTIPADYVISQGPVEPNHMIAPGSTVELLVSSGYPPEAKSRTVHLEVNPEEAGKESKVKIMYSDARGENLVWDERVLTKKETFPITVVVSPNQFAYITYYVNGNFIDSKRVDYEEVEQPEETPEEPPKDLPTEGIIEEQTGTEEDTQTPEQSSDERQQGTDHDAATSEDSSHEQDESESATPEEGEG